MSFIGQVYMVVMCIYNVIHSTTTLNGSTPIIFYGTTIITMILSVNVARRWPKLAQQISRTEELDPNFDDRLMKKCNITLTIVLTLALVEHVLSLIAAISGALVCLPNTPLYEAFAKYHYPWVFNFLPYYPLLGAITQFLHFLSTFAWNFSDVFVINMSHYLTSRLQQVNRKLIAVHGKYLPEAFWKNSRENYCRITKLVRIVDDVISGITFISFANNLFFICVQLFNTLEDGIKSNRECGNGSATSKSLILGGYEAAIYFVYSLVFLISRSLAVSLIASQVNIASVAPVSVLYDVPSPVYCVEVQRFIDQVNGKKVALSGLQFFSITRGLVLTVAGTIVTYELVMVQFSSGSSTSSSNTTTAATFFSSQVT